MNTFLAIMVIWSLVGAVFVTLWRSANALELYLGLVKDWKIVAAFILGGPIVWAIVILS